MEASEEKQDDDLEIEAMAVDESPVISAMTTMDSHLCNNTCNSTSIEIVAPALPAVKENGQASSSSSYEVKNGNTPSFAVNDVSVHSGSRMNAGVTQQQVESTQSSAVKANASRAALLELERFLKDNATLKDKASPSLSSWAITSANLAKQPFALVPLTKSDAQQAQTILWEHRVSRLRAERATDIANQQVTYQRPNNNDSVVTMKYVWKIYHPDPTNTTSPTRTNGRAFVKTTNGAAAAAAAAEVSCNHNATHSTSTNGFSSQPPCTASSKNQQEHVDTATDTVQMPLFIGLHGGGGCPAAVNDAQWKNHQQIYHTTFQQLATIQQLPILYVAPRAPTNSWNLWHEPHMDHLLDRLIEQLLVMDFIDNDSNLNSSRNDIRNKLVVDSNRIYIMGYSAGGDGIYMLAPRMADRWAGAAMMSGHPNGVSLRGIYNLPFTLHVGANDSAYNRNTIGRHYKATLEQWHQQEQQTTQPQTHTPKVLDQPQGSHQQEQANEKVTKTTLITPTGGYQDIWAKIHEDKGHWLHNQDALAIPWMARYTRVTFPTTLVWDKHSCRHARFYWAMRPPAQNQQAFLQQGGEIRIVRHGQTLDIDLTKCTTTNNNINNNNNNLDQIGSLTFRFNDDMVEMELPVSIYLKLGTTRQVVLQDIVLNRTIDVLSRTLQERGDPNAVWSAEITVDLSPVVAELLQKSDSETLKPPKHLRGSQDV